MKLLTSKKTLLVGALSLIGSTSAVLMSSEQSANLFALTQNNASTQHAVNSQRVNQERSYILQGLGADALVTAVQNVGGLVSREFPIINAISALLTYSQVSELGSYANLRVTEDHSVRTSSVGTGKLVIDTFLTKQTNASEVHALGIRGDGIGVAVLDSGILLDGKGDHLRRNTDDKKRVKVKYDTKLQDKSKELDDDRNGHGSHIASIIASNLQDENGNYNGMAPDVNIISVKAFDENGESSYSEVLDGLNWIYKHHNKYKIRVLNLSLGAKVRTNYWEDPINQAVMRLWEEGIVVVTSAGNAGGDMGTISVPGNNPYVITVGAVTDNYTPYDYSDDRVTTFSSRGPTYEGFIKPEIVAYGARVNAKFDGVSIATDFHSAENAMDYYSSSGTSQAAAVITGTVALMLEMDKKATPDDIKCRLISTANASFGSEATTSPFLKGAGLVDALKAVNSIETGCANTGLDIEADLEGIAHFTGPAHVDANGEFYISLNSGQVLSESTGWGVDAESTGWGVDAQSTGWGVDAQSTGWGVLNESTGWGVLAESTGWGVDAESTGWGVDAESTGWGVSTESLGDGTGVTSTSTDLGEDFVWDNTAPLDETMTAEEEEGI